jgi:hypothetical protein
MKFGAAEELVTLTAMKGAAAVLICRQKPGRHCKARISRAGPETRGRPSMAGRVRGVSSFAFNDVKNRTDLDLIKCY